MRDLEAQNIFGKIIRPLGNLGLFWVFYSVKRWVEKLI